MSSFSRQNNGDIAAMIPHPFFYNTPRAVTGVAPDLERRELTTHLQAAYVIPVGKKIDVAVSAGPSWFRITQALVTGLTFTERYPYDTASFSTATTTSASVTAVGVNAGVDVGVKLSKNAGLGGLLRYSHTSADLPLAGAAANPTVDAGGFQAGGGIRLFF